jgi:hypothetical protein
MERWIIDWHSNDYDGLFIATSDRVTEIAENLGTTSHFIVLQNPDNDLSF